MPSFRTLTSCYMWNMTYFSLLQGRSQNLKQVSQKFIKAFNVDGVTLISQLMTSYRKSNIESEKILNYRVTSPSNQL